MMTLSERLVAELTQEAATTRRVLERLPEDHLTWKPHAKSMTLGQLGIHIALLPKAISEMASELNRDAPQRPLPQPASVAEILSTLEKSVAAAAERVGAWSDADLEAIWTLSVNGRKVLELPRYWVLRTVMLNHSYHHRGQLALYLRMLDVPVPSVYGPTADENPFF